MFYAFAAPLSQRIYGNQDVARYLQIAAPLVPIMYMDMSVDGMLKGMDEQKASMMYNIIDSGLCVALVWFLLPRMAIKGYIIVLFVSEIYNFFFSIRRLLKVTDVPRPPLKDIAKALGATACAALIPLGLNAHFKADGMLASTPLLISGIVLSALIYLFILTLTGDITLPQFKTKKRTNTKSLGGNSPLI
jgi:stage V sporulation protein B